MPALPPPPGSASASAPDTRPASQGSVIVLGAGIAGLYAAERLSRAGFRVTVMDRGHQCGGVHQSRAIGNYTFDLGSIFYEEGAKIFELAPQMRERCPQVLRVQRRIAPCGTILHYPLNPRDMLRNAPWRLPMALLDLAASRAFLRRDGTLDAISRQRLGRTFFRSTGLQSYITRFHHLPPREIDEQFFFRRMGHIERSTRVGALARAALRSLSRRSPDSARPRRLLHVRPREGFDTLFAPVVRRLEFAGVEFRMGEEARRIDRKGSAFRVVSDRGTCLAEAVVSTIPLDTVHRAVLGSGSGLVSLDMTSLFVSAEWLDPRLGNVLFNFHAKGDWKRATIYSRIYPASGTEREFCTVEVTIAAGASHDPHASFADFSAHMTSLGLARGLALEGHECVEGSYPLYLRGSDKVLRDALTKIGATGIILAGRQGRFEYLPTSSGVIRQVEEQLEACEILRSAGDLAA
jgi:protoporphyrinogen oxidase